MTDFAIPTFSKPCACDRPEPVEDSDHTCPFCGRQVNGKAMPSKVIRHAQPAPRGESGRRRPRYAAR